MRDISDLLQLGLADEEIERLDASLDETYHAPGPWLAVTNRGPLRVAVEIAADECHGVFIAPTGPDVPEPELTTLILSKYRG